MHALSPASVKQSACTSDHIYCCSARREPSRQWNKLGVCMYWLQCALQLKSRQTGTGTKTTNVIPFLVMTSNVSSFVCFGTEGDYFSPSCIHISFEQ